MPDDDPAEVDALLGEDALLVQAAPTVRVRVGGDRRTGLLVGLGHRPQHPLDAGGGHPGFVGGALEDCGFHAGVGDALGDVADKHLGHDLRAVQQRSRSGEVEIHRDVVVGVDPGGHHDLQVGLRGHPLDARNVAAESDDGRVDDGVHPEGLQFVELGDGVGLPGIPRRPPSLRDSC